MKSDVLLYFCLFTSVFNCKTLILLPGMFFLDSGCHLRQYWSGLADNLIQTELLLNAEKTNPRPPPAIILPSATPVSSRSSDNSPKLEQVLH